MGRWGRFGGVPIGGRGKSGDSAEEVASENKTKGVSNLREPKNDARLVNTLVIMHALLLSGSSSPSSDLFSWSVAMRSISEIV
jgi:hypothetical protein